MTRVAKYIPVEAIGTQLTLQNLLLASKQKPDAALALAVVIFVVCLAAIPFYLIYASRPDKMAISNIIISMVAFMLWCYATPGSLFAQMHIQNNVVAAILLFVFTMAAGLWAPQQTTV